MTDTPHTPDPNRGTELVAINTPAGERHLVPLTPADWTDLANYFRAFRKRIKRAEILADGGTSEDVKREMDAMDRRPVRYGDVEKFVNDVAGQHYSILLSLRKVDPDADDAEFAALGLHPSEWLSTAARLWDLSLTPLEEEGGRAGGPLAGGGRGPADRPPPGAKASTSNTTSTSSATTSPPPTTPGSGPSPASTPPSAT